MFYKWNFPRSRILHLRVILKYWYRDFATNCSISITNTLDILQPCTEPTIFGIFIFSVSWIHSVGNSKGNNVAALEDNDITTCLTQDPRETLLLKTTVTDFSSLTVIVVSNQDYTHRDDTCSESQGHPWLLLTHVTPGPGSSCDPFCGTLRYCIHEGVMGRRGNLLWHRMKCNCGRGLCNELALHISPHHTTLLSICDLRYSWTLSFKKNVVPNHFGDELNNFDHSFILISVVNSAQAIILFIRDDHSDKEITGI